MLEFSIKKREAELNLTSELKEYALYGNLMFNNQWINPTAWFAYIIVVDIIVASGPASVASSVGQIQRRDWSLLCVASGRSSTGMGFSSGFFVFGLGCGSSRRGARRRNRSFLVSFVGIRRCCRSFPAWLWPVGERICSHHFFACFAPTPTFSAIHHAPQSSTLSFLIWNGPSCEERQL